MATSKRQAIDAFQGVMGTKEPEHERIVGQLGNAAGVVEVPNRPNFNYVRLMGDSTRTVRAYNLAVRPENDRYVWVEITRVEGEPKYYRVVGYSEYESEGDPANPPVYPGGQSEDEKVVVWTAGTFFSNEKMHNALSGAELHKNIASNIEMLEIPTADYDDVQDWSNVTQSAGHLSGMEVTDSGSGEVDVAAGTGIIKITDSLVGVNKFLNFAGTTNLALTNNSTNWIYINYNVGTGAVTAVATDDWRTLNLHTQFIIAKVYRDGNTLHITDTCQCIDDLARRVMQREYEVDGSIRAEGMIISSTTLYIELTAGAFYEALTRHPTRAQDTDPLGLADEFFYWHQTNGVWTEVTARTVIDNLQYNDITAGLDTLTANRYGVHWVFLDEDDHLNVVYGVGDYTSAQAKVAYVPSVPELLTEFAILVGKIVVQKNAAAVFSVESAFTEIFVGVAPSIHNGLAGLQGGTLAEYYHLTATEHGYISGGNAQSLLTTASPTFAGISLSGNSQPVASIEFLSDWGDLAHPALTLKSTIDGDMGDGFGTGIQFYIEDATSGPRQIALLLARRDGADTEGALAFYAGTGGVEEFLRVRASGNIEIPVGNLIPDGGVGTLGLVADPWDGLFVDYVTLGAGGWIGIAANNAIIFDTAGTRILFDTPWDICLMPTGKVGIGTLTPDKLLHLATTAASQELLKLESSHNSANAIYLGAYLYNDAPAEILYSQIKFGNPVRTAAAETGAISFNIRDAGAWDTRVTFTGSNVGIGTPEPDEKLHVLVSSGTATVQIDSFNSDATIKFATNTTEDWTIGKDTSAGAAFIIAEGDGLGGSPYLTIRKTNGRVGIATTSPGQILDVNDGSGNMIADGYDSHPSWLALKVDPTPMTDVIERFKQIKPYKYRRIPFVSADELAALAIAEFGEMQWEIVFPDGYRGGALQECPDPEIAAFLDREGDRLREERQSLPEWQRWHYGLAMDDLTETFPDVLSLDGSGYSLSSYVGILHGCITELTGRLEQLEAA